MRVALCRRAPPSRDAQSFDRIATYTIGTLNLTGTRESARIESNSSRPNTSRSPASSRSSGGPQARRPKSSSATRCGNDRLAARRRRSARPEFVARAADDCRRDGRRLPRPQRTGRGIRAAHHVAAHQLRRLLHVRGVFPNVIATLKPGVDAARAQSELSVLAGRMAAVVPSRSDDATDRGGLLMPLSQARTNASVVRARTYVAVGAYWSC